MISGTVAVQIIESKFVTAATDIPGLLWDKGNVAKSLGISSYPAAVLIGADGTIPTNPVHGASEVLRLIEGIEEAVAYNQSKSADRG